jgi:hypothetical protein
MTASGAQHLVERDSLGRKRSLDLLKGVPLPGDAGRGMPACRAAACSDECNSKDRDDPPGHQEL